MWRYKGFRHLAQNCRNIGKKKEEMISCNKFEVLSSRVIQCGVKEKTIRRQETIETEYFKCGERGHKYKGCPLWEKVEKKRVEKRAACVVIPQKAQQKELKKAEERETACMAKSQKVQQEGWKRSLVHVL